MATEESPAGALELLEREHGLLAGSTLAPMLARLTDWEQQGIRVLTAADREYPDNLRAVYDRPPVLFVAGRLLARDWRAVAVIGARTASPTGLRSAGEVARALGDHGFAVISGLAAGIDTAAHTAALDAGARTIAAVAHGLRRCYPPGNAPLQARIASLGAVVSLRWPDAPPTREAFHARNALMSGLSLASVIIEAGPRSGCRVQARAALAHGRPVLINRSLLAQDWGQGLASRPGVWPFSDPREVPEIVCALACEKQLHGA